MKKVLQKLYWQTILLYLDIIIVVGRNFKTHLERLAEILQILRTAGLKLKPTKCEKLKEEVLYLGHTVNAQEIGSNPKKVHSYPGVENS